MSDRAWVPEPFRELVAGRPAAGRPAAGWSTGDDWLGRLPRLVDECLDQWRLSVDGSPRHGQCALVLPVRRDDGVAAVLKVSWPHPEAEHEHLALSRWAGRGAVLLLAADPGRWALLLERLAPDRDLTGEPIEAACATIGGLLRALDRPALPQLGRLSARLGVIAQACRGGSHGLPRRYAQQAGALAAELISEPGIDARLVHTDLHYENVLSAERAPWLAIDPKPMAADPAFALAPALWNRWDEVVASDDIRAHLRWRLGLICAAAGIDADRARVFVLVREVENALWAAEDGDRTRVSQAVATIKAMSD